MTKQTRALRILVTLYRTASRGRFLALSNLSQLVDLEETVVKRLLVELDRAGYVDSEQLRLTLPGLAIAVAAAKRPNMRAFAQAA
jgi:DNA-binding IclR family transcriptional regulator